MPEKMLKVVAVGFSVGQLLFLLLLSQFCCLFFSLLLVSTQSEG